MLVENFRPGAMARLGLSYDEVAAFNPGIVYLSISGFGQTGPNAQVRVYDPVIQAVAGFADAHPDLRSGEPQLLQTLMCDKLTALTAAQALTAALFARQRLGRGQKIELSMLDVGGGLSLAGGLLQTTPSRTSRPRRCPSSARTRSSGAAPTAGSR